MRKEYRLTANKDYREVYTRGSSAANRYLVVYYLKTDEEYPRIGFSVSRKIGSAVVRNRIRRLLKEAVRRNEAKIKHGYDIVFIARQPIKGKSFHGVEKAFIDILLKAGLLQNNDENDSDSAC